MTFVLGPVDIQDFHLGCFLIQAPKREFVIDEQRLVVSDQVWERLGSLLPGKASDSGRTAGDNRLILEAVFWPVRTGSPWRDLPERLGNWNSQFRRFRRRAESGVFLRCIPTRNDRFKPLAVSRRNRERHSRKHATDSHAADHKGVLNRTLLNGSIHV